MKKKVERRTVQPDALLLHESFMFSLYPPHVGMRHYWRDFAALERWARSAPHRQWWQQFLQDSGGTGIWHETYCMRGDIEAVYDDMAAPIGLMKFAPVQAARGSLFAARSRLGMAGEARIPAPVSEEEHYGKDV